MDNLLISKGKIFAKEIPLIDWKYNPANISTSVPRCFWVDMTSRRRTTSNQRWNNVVYVNVEIYNVEQRWNNAVFFNVELNNVRQRRNYVVIFNADFHNVGQRQNNVVEWPFEKKLSLNSKTNQYF